ncbi:MAG TPA: hypothetical protein VN494_03435 [Patescibacteria group bacterium]|nr:hypothetical protein [Patescibacteria group bacterium]
MALKTFRPEYRSDLAARDRFLREGIIWTEWGCHSHLVRAHGVEFGRPAPAASKAEAETRAERVTAGYLSPKPPQSEQAYLKQEVQ